MTTASIDLFQRLFIGDDGYQLMVEIAKQLSCDSLGMIQEILTFYEAHKQTLHFLDYLIHLEISKSENGTMFRGNSFCSRCLTVYTLMTMSNQYVISFLEEPMTKVLKGEYKNLEINPDFAIGPIDESIFKLKEIVQIFITRIIDTINLWPESYRYLCYSLYSECEKTTTLQPLQCVSGFLVLRVICPAIMQPHKTGFCNEKPNNDIMRGLIMICKVIQNIANGTLPHEPYMKCLSEFISKETIALQFALEKISLIRPTKFSFVPVKEKELESAMNSIIIIWKNNIKNVDNYLQQNCSNEFKELAHAVIKYSSKGYLKRKRIMNKKMKEDIAINQLFNEAKQGSVTEVQTIIKKYPEIIDCTDVDMMTPLHYACVFKNIPVALFLYNKGSSLYLQDAMGFSALHYACQANLIDLLNLIKESNFVDVGMTNEEGNSCLHYLVQHEFTQFHFQFLDYLTSKDEAIINIQNYAGDSPLHYAVCIALNNIEAGRSTISALIQHGADCHLRNMKGKTPMDLVEEKGRTDLEIVMMSETVVKPSTVLPESPSDDQFRLRSNSGGKKTTRRNSLLLHRSPASPRLLAAYQSRGSLSRKQPFGGSTSSPVLLK
ncbi:Ras GTPase activating protein, putative [Entamoeba histolytica HM-1:IMSS-B]|uniref:Ras GTPase activating protein, putative n=6 Tax=Entamoeba histolytica TaxID=5759 RepID=C4LZX7_ENTH1|nr:Ras GTPase activating protein, putative [Entamoeba histolytica HM-1:IMSS]EMD49117.1 Ras GTPase activating protein, putative [Entamoeba histolytica KU27]EMH73930.1 Ras GTPase activating protein, putative [Entamoeba histolytica HM-1:IMSS-B]EMS15653.1 Ras GTPase activating protein, putative [Entamoeba histolytica HM-3:IMSS]ENY61949.1 Ras GTPase activating protein, putative [Entamoeba histolytica HM-1:IMSS-A]GAT94440.1 Ras GTPase activating protein putative [Entamoeba histolytica]|eukprot:XP_653637.1 Ras GTPase activating protein, putative [Entamoeba histolytica HM-1:IMSS]